MSDGRNGLLATFLTVQHQYFPMLQQMNAEKQYIWARIRHSMIPTAPTWWLLPPSLGKRSNFYHITLKACLHLNMIKKRGEHSKWVYWKACLHFCYVLYMYCTIIHILLILLLGTSYTMQLMAEGLPWPGQSCTTLCHRGMRLRFSRTAAQTHHLQFRGPSLIELNFNCHWWQGARKG